MPEHELACDCVECLPLRTSIAKMWSEVAEALAPVPLSPLDEQVAYLLRALASERYASHELRMRNAALEARVCELTGLIAETVDYLDGAGDGANASTR